MEQVIGAAQAKARFLRLLDLVAAGRTAITVTKRGRAVARIVPIEEAPQERKQLWGALKGTVLKYERPFAPASDPNEWSAISGDEDNLY
jgi:prevent-host-death family protein